MDTWRRIRTHLAVCTALLYLLLPVSGQASEKTGVYVTPKLTANFMSWQAHGEGGVTSFMTSAGQQATGHVGAGSWDFTSGRADTLWGGALAIGYDFYPRFDLPLRVELEYGRYSDASGSTDYTLSPAQIDQALGLSGKAANSASKKRATWMEAELKLKNIQTLLLNAYWDFHNSTNFTPYIGAGVGLAFLQAQGMFPVSMASPDIHRAVFYDRGFGMKNATNFAWQVGVGCSYAFTDTIALDLGYRFMGLGSVESNTSYTTDVNKQNGYTCIMNMRGQAEAKDIYMHQIALGLRISF